MAENFACGAEKSLKKIRLRRLKIPKKLAAALKKPPAVASETVAGLDAAWLSHGWSHKARRGSKMSSKVYSETQRKSSAAVSWVIAANNLSTPSTPWPSCCGVIPAAANWENSCTHTQLNPHPIAIIFGEFLARFRRRFRQIVRILGFLKNKIRFSLKNSGQNWYLFGGVIMVADGRAWGGPLFHVEGGGVGWEGPPKKSRLRR